MNLQFIHRYQYPLIWLAVYIFLIASSIRFDWMISLVSSTSAIIGMLLIDRVIRMFLIPRLLRPHRQALYYLVGFLVIQLFVWVLVHGEIGVYHYLHQRGWLEVPREMSRGELIFPFFRMLFLLLGTFAITTISYLLSQSKEAIQRNDELRNEKLDMELRYLKAQINPHFLFNALNNIYSLVYTNDENAAESILKLSEMLRYVTDECQTDKISISKELKYIENFIDFQLMRMENHPNIEFVREIRNPDFKIPPMILQPLIENCFKHSRLENSKEGYVKISVLQQDRELRFIAENNQSSCVFNKQTARGGIGIENVRKRLDLAYGSRYSFDVENNSQFYKVELHIKL